MLVARLDWYSSESRHLEGLYWDNYRTSYLLRCKVIIFLIYFVHSLSLCSHDLRLLEPHRFRMHLRLGVSQDVSRVILDFCP